MTDENRRTDRTIRISQRIRRLREAAGMSQFQLADRLHISNAKISKFESGKGVLDLDEIERITRILGISWAALVDDSDVPFKKAVHELTERSLDDELRGRRNHHDQPSGEEAPGKIERLLVTA